MSASDGPRDGHDTCASYRALFTHARAAILLADDEGRYVDVNPAACALLGYSREELLQLTICDVTPPEMVEESKARWRAMVAGAPLRAEHTMVRKDGSRLPVEFDAVANVLPGLHLTINRDLTERHRTLDLLRASEQTYMRLVAELQDSVTALRSSQSLLQSVVTSAPIVLFALDRSGVFTLSEGRGLAALGLVPGQVIGVSALELYADHPALIEQLRRALDGEAFSSTADVAGNSYEMWYSPAQDWAAGLMGTVGVAIDVTERRRLEEQLQQAQKLESIGQLAGGIAHDFNNILMAIIGYADLVISRVPPGGAMRDEVTEIKRAAERASLLTHQLLAFSRKQLLRPKTLNLNDVITDVVRMLNRLIGEDVTIVTRLEANLGAVSADPGQLAQVIMNLAVNGRDAMPHGGVLAIETGNIDLDEEYAAAHVGVQPGPFVMLAVSDSGIGMSAEVQQRVFEPFFTTKPVGKGTGMGLASVYGIVKQSGGHVWVYSEAGHGSTFKVFLPRVLSEDSLEPAATTIATLPRGSETILLVEDDSVVRALVKRTLESWGYVVLEASDGPSALEIFRQDGLGVSLLMTDIVMPGMSGRELALECAAVRPGIPVLFMSGYTDNTVLGDDALDAATHFLQKPFAMQTLATKVREVIDR